MKTIRQVTLDANKPVNELLLREGFRVVKTEYSLTSQSIEVWIEEPLRADLPVVTCFLKVVGNSQPVPLVYEYISSAYNPFEHKAMHVFSIPESVVRTEPTHLSAVA